MTSEEALKIADAIVTICTERYTSAAGVAVASGLGELCAKLNRAGLSHTFTLGGPLPDGKYTIVVAEMGDAEVPQDERVQATQDKDHGLLVGDLTAMTNDEAFERRLIELFAEIPDLDPCCPCARCRATQAYVAFKNAGVGGSDLPHAELEPRAAEPATTDITEVRQSVTAEKRDAGCEHCSGIGWVKIGTKQQEHCPKCRPSPEQRELDTDAELRQATAGQLRAVVNTDECSYADLCEGVEACLVVEKRLEGDPRRTAKGERWLLRMREMAARLTDEMVEYILNNREHAPPYSEVLARELVRLRRRHVTADAVIQHIEDAYQRAIEEPGEHNLRVLSDVNGARVKVEFPFLSATPTMPAAAVAATKAIWSLLEQFPRSVRCAVLLTMCAQMEVPKQ